MTTTTRRLAILLKFRELLQGISLADGFATDAGENVYLQERPQLGKDDPDIAIAILVQDDEPKWQQEHVFVTLPIEIQALAKADITEPWIAAEQVLGDIKKAMEIEDRTLGRLVKRAIERGTTRTIARDAGATTVGIAITYNAPYAEVWGGPQL